MQRMTKKRKMSMKKKKRMKVNILTLEMTKISNKFLRKSMLMIKSVMLKEKLNKKI